MKKTRANLHMPKKKAIIVTASFSMLSILVNVLFLFTINGEFGRLHALCQSEYVYSGNVQTSPSQDSYYQLNAGISMYLSADANNSLNAEIVMQTEKADYTQSVSWNTDTLKKNEIAITHSIANMNFLKPGDILYSKHVVTGKKEAYTIKDILSEATTTNEVRNHFSDGIIIMGYDEMYVNNISFSTIVYVSKQAEKMIKTGIELPTNLTYRFDEVQMIIYRIVPYLTLFFLLTIVTSITIVAILTKEVMPNMRRLKFLGTEGIIIDYSYRRQIYSSSIIAFATALIISVVIALLSKSCIFSVVMLIAMLAIQILAIYCSACFIRKRFWRD